jgi:hypothetical protein
MLAGEGLILTNKSGRGNNIRKTITEYCMRVAPKLMPPILLCWSMMSEVDVDNMAIEVEPSHQYSIKFCCHVTAERQP